MSHYNESNVWSQIWYREKSTFSKSRLLKVLRCGKIHLPFLSQSLTINNTTHAPCLYGRSMTEFNNLNLNFYIYAKKYHLIYINNIFISTSKMKKL